MFDKTKDSKKNEGAGQDTGSGFASKKTVVAFLAVACFFIFGLVSTIDLMFHPDRRMKEPTVEVSLSEYMEFRYWKDSVEHVALMRDSLIVDSLLIDKQ